MSARTLAAFSTIRTEGAMLPSDILVRVASVCAGRSVDDAVEVLQVGLFSAPCAVAH